MSEQKFKKLTSGSILARNTVLNLVGQGVPMVVAIFAIPLLIKGLGTARFGVLTLAWMVIGYFSLFDIGLGRALTKLVAEKLGAGQENEIPVLVWTALCLMGGLGLIGTIVLAILSPLFVQDVLNIPDALQQETLQSFYLLAVSIPVVISTAGLRGILQAYQRFDLINAIQIPMGIFMFLGPLFILPFSNSLFPVVAILMLSRFIAWIVHFPFCFHVAPLLRSNISLSKEVVKPLLSFGGWITVSNVISPLMVYLDRFVIGVMLSMTAVAYYSTPYDMVTRLLVIPSSMVGVLFSAFSTSFIADRDRAGKLFETGTNYIFILMFPITLVIVSFAQEGMTLWLGEQFAQHSAAVLRWLAVGVFINSLAQVPFASIQADGRPDITAKLHFLELPLYMVLLWLLLREKGIEGAAIAWVIRVLIDTILLYWFAFKMFLVRLRLKRTGYCIFLGILFVGLISVVTTLIVKIAMVVIVLLFFFTISWYVLLGTQERNWLKTRIKLKIDARQKV